MTDPILCADLRRLPSGEFAVRDKSLGWRFLEQGDEDGLPHELACTPERLARVSARQPTLLLYQMPTSFKTGFMGAFYGVFTAPSHLHRDPKEILSAESRRNNLHTLLLLMGFNVGRRALSKVKHSSPWELQLQLF
jgi:hypothetical protein